ncbi:MAG: hypothetical protein K6C97_12415 [Treponema sp.]|nr:hypothetical protein [Treponema sp.]
MKYLIGFVVGIIVGIVLFNLWKKKYSKYLPMEDSFLLNFICGVLYILACIISGILFASTNAYAMSVALVILLLLFAISYGFGAYYKTIATKDIKM